MVRLYDYHQTLPLSAMGAIPPAYSHKAIWMSLLQAWYDFDLVGLKKYL